MTKNISINNPLLAFDIFFTDKKMNLRNPYERYQQNMNINLVSKEEEEEKEKDNEYRGGDKIAFALKMNYITKS